MKCGASLPRGRVLEYCHHCYMREVKLLKAVFRFSHIVSLMLWRYVVLSDLYVGRPVAQTSGTTLCCVVQIESPNPKVGCHRTW